MTEYINQEVKKDVSYLNKDFSSFRANLINFVKTYFPDTYNDFNETSPGMMLIELSAYLGDVLSYYTDTSFKESLLQYAKEYKNVINLSQTFGYHINVRAAANTELDVFQLVPALGSGIDARPDMRYALRVNTGGEFIADNATIFRSTQPIDFTNSGSIDPMDVSVYEIDGSGNVLQYLLKKSVPVVSGNIKSQEYTFDNPKIYDKIVIDDERVIEVVDVYDDNGNKWYEVDYLAQDTIMEDIENITYNDPTLSKYRSTTPYILKLKRVPRRFIKRVRSDGLLELRFGAGVSSDADEEIIPNPKNVGMGLSLLNRTTDTSLDPSNFLHTSTYGLAPGNMSLTVRYTTGEGLSDNVGINSITTIQSIAYGTNDNQALDLTAAKASVAVTNPEPARGARAQQDIESLRNNAMANFASQNRVVTREDYIARVYAMPPKFGSVAKAYIVGDSQIDTSDKDYPRDTITNPLALNMYCLGYDTDSKLVGLNTATKENLRTYISQYRLLTDAINIKKAYIINIAIDFEIIVLPTYNANEVLLRCIEYLRNKFHIDKMQINAPIMLNSCKAQLDLIEGVQTVVRVDIKNKFDTNSGFSGNVYDITTATKDGIVYPSLDPSIFELKYPDSDIRGKVNQA